MSVRAKGLICSFLFSFMMASDCHSLEFHRVTNSTLRLEGQIVPGDLEALKSQIGQIEEIELNVSGGHAEEAISIGNYIRQKNLILSVVGICASGCAQYLLPSAKSVNIRKGALVIFHHYPFVLYEQAKRLGFQLSEIENRIAEADRNILSTFKIDEDFAYRALIELAPKCIEQRLYGNEMLVRYDGPFQGWIPQKSYLQSVGMNLTGYWPETIDDLVSAAKQRFSQSKQNFSIRFSYQTEKVSKAEAIRLLSSIPRCP